MAFIDLVKKAVTGDQVETPATEPEQQAVVEQPVAEETEAATTPVEETAPLEQVEAPPVDLATTVSNLTQNKFQSIEDLYTKYQELESKTPEPEFPDEWSKGLFERIKAGHDITPYLEAKTVNLKEMTPEQLFRKKLKDEYGVSGKDLERLYKDEVIDKYKLDPESYEEDEISVGKLRMAKAAEAIRSEYEEKLKPYLQPGPLKQESETQESPKPEGPTEEEIMAQFKEFEQKLKTSPQTKELLEKKTFIIPTVDDEKFNLEVESPEELVDMAVNSEKFFGLFNTENGPDLQRFYQVASFARDPDKFIKLLVAHGKELGQAKVLKEIENPSQTHSGPTSKQYEDPFHKLFATKLNKG